VFLSYKKCKNRGTKVSASEVGSSAICEWFRKPWNMEQNRWNDCISCEQR